MASAALHSGWVGHALHSNQNTLSLLSLNKQMSIEWVHCHELCVSKFNRVKMA